MFQHIMSYFVGEGMSEQPQRAGLLASEPGQFVTYKDPMLAKTEA